MAVYHWSKGIAVISLLLGTLVLAVAGWTFGSIIIYRQKQQATNKTEDHLYRHIPTFHKDQRSSQGFKPSVIIDGRKITGDAAAENGVTFDTDNTHDHHIIPETKNSSVDKPSESDDTKLWATFGEMPETFQGVIIGCDWVAVIGALLQIASSVLIIFSSAKKVPSRSKYFVVFHFLALLILLLTLFFPLAYDRQGDGFHSMTSFSTEVKNWFEKLKDANFLDFTMTDLYPYYFLLLLDCFCIFVTIIIASCLIRYYISASNKLEVFYDRYR